MTSPGAEIRKNWGEAFQEMSDREDDKLLLEDDRGASTLDDEEWVWNKSQKDRKSI